MHCFIFIILGLLCRVNVSVGPEEERLMMSGMHTVADIFCCGCGQLLGWKYVSPYTFIITFGITSLHHLSF